ncbi:conserved hypothetical protein [Chlamydia pneumoniae LPCoLN]|uniref:DUF1207 domain-containing protein n=2 Tax=Chlamydia pneumoniae TaxID=83558 RepID=Q9K2B1_CHLPN|nr:DUF1207 domain-containing protein [Chlamydia pneumoniae]AAF38125.1 conserved hypothetical protein [Chlamydia pneumoniae AR39]ACZ33468.1 conserved hypothetical protein [Chlamydia pneumoniae LPCoLN]CRI33002.1 Uncharacterized protein BN1224_Wien1_A_05090 [Chlamydia pneumoniae]CRI35865.1 Uncharacterized protein BN1224_CM1_A_05120 [Chlamydia pneumoniae]CRI36992.1 Uncharacterized protein BN1224_CV14_A_05110 [Chlamydia pneumoniae]
MKTAFHSCYSWFCWLFSFLVLFVGGIAGGEPLCPDCKYETKSVLRSDQLPDHLWNYENDCYLTGYVQSLLDMHFLDSRTQVVIEKNRAYLFSLPVDSSLSEAITNFVRDLPFICAVEICERPYGECITRSSAERPLLPKEKTLGMPIFCGKEGVWLPQNTILFSPLIADPRQVTNSAGIRFNEKVVGNRVGATIFGGDFILLRLFDVSRFHVDCDFGIQGGVFSVFDLDHPESCMVNSDFFVAGLWSGAIDKWSFRFRLWHLSSHLGDEFILTHPNFPRFNLSDEGVDLFISFRYTPQIRLYGGCGYIVSRDLTFPERPFYCEWGAELRPFGLREGNLHAQPIFAMHFRCWEEQKFGLDQSYILGMEWAKFQEIGRKIRAVLEYHQGFSKEGQFIREPCNYYGFRLTYGF